jgi:uncharacterized membrane protein
MDERGPGAERLDRLLMTSVDAVREVVYQGAQWIRLCLETAGAVAIALGAISTIVQMTRQSAAREHVSFAAARSSLSRYLVLALEFQLAADILNTAIAPGWGEIGRLASIAAIRTGLNYFLSREIKEERDQVKPVTHAAT